MARNRSSYGLFLAAGVVALVVGNAGAFAGSAPDTPRGNAGGRSLLSTAARGGAAISRWPVAADGRLMVLVELEEVPVVASYAAARAESASIDEATSEVRAVAAAQQQLTRVVQEQLSVQSMLESAPIGAAVIFKVQRVLNGIAAYLDPESLDLVRSLPGVKAVRPLRPQQLDNFSSVPLIGAPAVWDVGGGSLRGQGVRIGIIDTGVDYIHKDFAGSGSYSGQVYNDTTVPWTAKVVGGTDLAGDSYDAGSSEPTRYTPTPDGDPMDCNGHGTHVAGTAAGFGVTAAGGTYPGPWTSGMDFASMKIGPGVAPEAQIFAIKVFGCSGSTLLVAQALDWAVDPNRDGNLSDHLDVVNISIGAPFGGDDDPDAEAADAAALAGTVVVCSAGNSGDTFYVTGGSGVADRAISTASSVDAASAFDAFRVNSPASIAGVYVADFSSQYDWEHLSPLSGNLAYPATQNSGCAAFDTTNAALLAGKIALLDWTDGACGSAVRTNNAADAGAIGVVIAYNHPELAISIAGSDRIPSVVTTQAAGSLFKANLAQTVNVTLSNEYAASQKQIDNAIVDMVSSFSSRGVRIGNGALKPDIAAPGETIVSAAAGSGNGAAVLGGTSMAAPHMTGVMALLRQLHPAWTVEELKALAMNTARHDLYVGSNRTPPTYGPSREGAGRVDVPAAAAGEVIAYDANGSGRVGLMFGAPEVFGTYSATRAVRVVNKGVSSRSYTLGYVAAADTPGVSYSFPGGSTLSVAGGASAQFEVKLQADAAAMRHPRDPAMLTEQGSVTRAWMAEESGFVTLTPTVGDGALRLPVYASPRPASAMTVREGQIAVSGSPVTGSLSLSGHGIDSGSAYPVDVRSLASAFELQAVDPNDSSTPSAEDMRDIAYVGVASDYEARVALGQGLEQTILEFGIATHGDWSTLGQTFFRIDIDTNRDTVTDYYLYATDLGSAQGGDPSDVLISLLCPAGNGTCYYLPLNGLSASVADTAPFNTNVLVLPVSASRLGLVSGASRFSYEVKSYWGYLRDSAGVRTYDPAAPGVQFYGSTTLPALFDDEDGGSLPFTYKQDNFQLNASLGALVLHHHNGHGNRAQALSVVSTACALDCSATVPSAGTTGAVLDFQASATSAGCAGSPTYDWDYGDGSPHGTGATAGHSYASAGSYVWKLTVSAGASTCSRTGVVTISGVPAAAYRYVVGAVAHNAGQGGSQWRMGAGMVNRSGSSASVTVTYFSAGAPQVRTLALPHGAAVEWLDVLEQLFSMAPSTESQGTIVVASDRPLAITARTYNQSASGTFGQYIPALTDADTVTSGQTGVLPHLKKNASFRTNLGLVNLSPTSCSVAVKLYGASGAQIGTTRSFSVDGQRWFQQSDIFGAVSASGSYDIAYATVEVTTVGCRVWAYGSVVDGGTNDPTTIPVLIDPTAHGSLAAAQPAVVGQGVFRDRGPRTVTAVSGPSGMPWGGGFGAQQAAGSTVLFQDDFEAGFPGLWTAVDFSGTGWGLSSARVAGTGHSVWCAGGGDSPSPAGGSYAPGMEAWMFTGPFDLSDATSATMTFDTWFKTQESKDFFWVLVSVDGDNWIGYKFSGDSSSDSVFGPGAGGWGTVSLDFAELTDYIDPFVEQVWVAFLFESNALVEYEGAYVDNVALAKTGSGPSCSVTCSATVPGSATAGEAVQFQAQVTLQDCIGSAAFDWSFGDSSGHSAEQSPSHTFAAAGTYNWTLTVTADGATCTKNGSITVGAATQSHTYVVGGMAHNGGQGGSQWRTDAACVNRSASPAHLVLVYYAAGGTTTTRTATLGAGATLEWRNILESLFGFATTSESQGTVHVTSDVPLLITARTYNQSSAGSFGQYLPALEGDAFAATAVPSVMPAAASEVSFGQVAIIPQLKNNAAFRCNAGAVNLSAQQCSVKLTLFDASGSSLGSPVVISPAGGRWVQRSNIFDAAGVSGSVNVAYATVEVTTAGCTAWVYASVVDNGTSDPTTIPAIVR